MFSLKNKTALVTGAASGIGVAMAETFAQAGAAVWIADRNAAEGKTAADRIGAKFISLDVTSEGGCAQAAQTVGPLDILANVAGIGHVGHLLGTTAADLDRLYAVNVRGVFNCCAAFVPAMLKRQAGSVINMASIAGVVAVVARPARRQHPGHAVECGDLQTGVVGHAGQAGRRERIARLRQRVVLESRAGLRRLVERRHVVE